MPRPAGPLPSAEELGVELVQNPVLAALVAKSSGHARMGRHRVHVVLSGMGLREAHTSLPFLQRLGLGVQLATNDAHGLWFPVAIDAPGRTPALHNLVTDERHGYLWPRSFRQVRMRGVVKCVPKLLALLRAARIRLVDPATDARAECAAAAADVRAAELDALGRTAAEAHVAEQDERKRALVAALFAPPDEVEAGARWAGIRRRGAGGGVEPMRVMAIREQLFFFGPSFQHGNLEQRILHRDEFEVVWLRGNSDPARGDVADGKLLELNSGPDSYLRYRLIQRIAKRMLGPEGWAIFKQSFAAEWAALRSVLG